MKRRSSSSKKMKFRSFGESISRLFFFMVKAVPAFALIFLIFWIFSEARQFLYADSHFQVASFKIFPKGILTQDEYNRIEKEIGGKNLLTVDLKNISSFIKRNPYVKNVNVSRKLPQEIEIVIEPRRPLAELHLTQTGETYTLDQDGVVMSVNKIPNTNAVQLYHLFYPKKKLSLLDHYQSDSFKKLPIFLNAFKENSVTKQEILRDVSIDHLGNFSAHLHDGLELKVCQDFISNLQKLSPIANVLRTDERNALSYVDLCLSDVVVQRK